MKKTLDRKWHIIDLDGEAYGRALSKAACYLIGKNKVNYVNNIDMGDYVVLINADKVKITGNKKSQKMYYKHTGYIGNLKQKSLSQSIETSIVDTIKKSVKGMLPKNKTLESRINRLKVYSNSVHPHNNIKFEEN